MANVINDSLELVKKCQDSLVQTTAKSVELEDELKRATMLRGHKEAIITESRLEIESISRVELALRVGMEERVFLVKRNLCESHMEALKFEG